jgi:hypothetical protein
MRRVVETLGGVRGEAGGKKVLARPVRAFLVRLWVSHGQAGGYADPDVPFWKVPLNPSAVISDSRILDHQKTVSFKSIKHIIAFERLGQDAFRDFVQMAPQGAIWGEECIESLCFRSVEVCCFYCLFFQTWRR